MEEAARNNLTFYLSPEHACGYLPGRMARTVFLDPQAVPRHVVYQRLAEHGFRRSGPFLYRPECKSCQACVPLRIPITHFQPDRSQRRVWRRNQDLTVQVLAPRFDAEHFALYQRYLEARHPGGGMDQHSEVDYNGFLMSRWSASCFVEMRLAGTNPCGTLVAVAVVDVFTDALSAVYTFYEPALSRRGLGTFAILWEISEARRRKLEWLYLGYWVAGSPKMAYKNRFRPCQRLGPDGWKQVP